MNAIENGSSPVVESPCQSHSSCSLADASSAPPASSRSVPAPASASKVSRTGAFRAATSATRRTASAKDPVDTDAVAELSLGSSERYFGNSPSSRRDVVRRLPPSKPIIPSEPPDVDSATVTSGPLVSAFAVSARVRAGTSAVVDSPGTVGFHGSVRTARR